MAERKRKRRKSPAKRVVRQLDQTDNHLEDRISQLPDGILVQILSLLTIKEAGRSSVLSHKWRDLWKFTAGLNFDASEKLLKLYGKKKLKERERSKYVAWVNQVLKLHQRPSLNEFRVGFELDIGASHDIDEWIKFSMTKRVKRLEFDLNSYCPDKRYTLSQECYLRFKSPSNLFSIKCLTRLSLKGINVSGELLEYFLANCPHLELLRIWASEHLVNLKVVGPSLQLKHLEIIQCNCLESLEVCAPKLVTFKYYGKQIRLRIGNLPLLAELKIGGDPGHRLSDSLVLFSSRFSQLETLELRMFYDANKEILRVPELTNLKHLILDVVVGFGKSLLGFTSLIEASPSLRKFTLKLGSFCNSRERLAKTFTHHPHQRLKDVEIFGFTGGRSDLELVMYLLQNAVNLGTITIDPHQSAEILRGESKEKEQARKFAHQLEEKLPPGVKLFVL